MQFLPPSITVMPLSGAVPQPSAGSQDIENFAQSATDESGLFAQILSQLGLGHPLDAPLAPSVDATTLYPPTPAPSSELAPAGKDLPLARANPGQTLPLPASMEVTLQRSVDAADGPLVSPAPSGARGPLDAPGAAITSATALVATPRPAQSMPTQLPGVLPDGWTRAITLQPAPGPAATVPASQALLLPETSDNTLLQQQIFGASNAMAPSSSVSLHPNPAMPAPGPATPPQYAYTLNQPVADPQWGGELGRRLIWMNENGIGRAELRMNPPELGPVEVRIAVSSDDARVAFQVQHAATREALENAMPRLRELFASQGLDLDASVSEHAAQDQSRPWAGTDHERDADGAFGELAGELADAPDDVRATLLDGVIDTYV